jgi:predicted amidohydrolase YtcJ
VLIRNAELRPGTITNVRVKGARIAAVDRTLAAEPGEPVLDARGGALLPGLHDHHVHLLALAASLESLRCGPPEISTEEHLERQLRGRAAQLDGTRDAWIRGIGYHEAVAGDLDRAWLDRVVPEVPVRIQHRSGRLWIVNSRGLALLIQGADHPGDAPLPDSSALATGRLLDADRWLRQRLGGQPPDLHRVSALLASYGVTGVTDAGARNALEEFRHFVDCAARGELQQSVMVMGDASLDGVVDSGSVRRGPTKLYLRDSALPALEDFCASIERSHVAGRAVAVHCVTETEVVFAISALSMAGCRQGDRIEHASVAPPAVLALLAEHGLTVVTQPNFVRERGDAYLAAIPDREQPWLYRGRGFLNSGIALAAGTDAPLGDPNPWLAMQAAVDRRTLGARVLGDAEALTPEEALALFSGDRADRTRIACRSVRARPAVGCCPCRSRRSQCGRHHAARSSVMVARLTGAISPDCSFCNCAMRRRSISKLSTSCSLTPDCARIRVVGDDAQSTVRAKCHPSRGR